MVSRAAQPQGVGGGILQKALSVLSFEKLMPGIKQRQRLEEAELTCDSAQVRGVSGGCCRQKQKGQPWSSPWLNCLRLVTRLFSKHTEHSPARAGLAAGDASVNHTNKDPWPCG